MRVPYIPISVTNTTDCTIWLDRNKVIGHLETVKTVYTTPVQTKENEITAETKDSTETKLTLHYTSPVQKTYMSVPKPLHNEVKEYLQDLLRRGWITPSRFPYSSPVVCVRKKGGSFRLGVDFRELNRPRLPSDTEDSGHVGFSGLGAHGSWS